MGSILNTGSQIQDEIKFEFVIQFQQLQLMADDGGDKQFIPEQVTKILEDSINNLFGIKQQHSDKEHNAIYSKQKANASINSLIDYVIRRLCQLNKPFKYCVTGLHMQNNGAGVYSSASAYNNPDSDGAVVVQKEIGDNLIILTIFGMQI